LSLLFLKNSVVELIGLFLDLASKSIFIVESSLTTGFFPFLSKNRANTMDLEI
jgi:hypothetical protein